MQCNSKYSPRGVWSIWHIQMYRINSRNSKGPSTDIYRTPPPLKTGTLSEKQLSTATLGSAKKEVFDLLLGIPGCHRGVASRVN